jgi:hypothetical protein
MNGTLEMASDNVAEVKCLEPSATLRGEFEPPSPPFPTV